MCGCRVRIGPPLDLSRRVNFPADGGAKQSLLEAQIKVPHKIDIERSWHIVHHCDEGHRPYCENIEGISNWLV